MSYFIRISAQTDFASLKKFFPDEFEIVLVDTPQSGSAGSTGGKDLTTVLVLSKGCSTNIMNLGPKKFKLAENFKAALANLVNELKYVSVAVHYFRGRVQLESATITAREKITVSEFANIFPSDVKVDVRYAIQRDRESEKGVI